MRVIEPENTEEELAEVFQQYLNESIDARLMYHDLIGDGGDDGNDDGGDDTRPDDGTDGGDNDYQGPSEAPSEVVVDSGSDLQDALYSNGVIRISGVLDVSSESPIEVPNYRSLYGHGSFEFANHPQTMDVVYDDSPGPTFDITGNHVRFNGFAIANNHPEGIGISCTGYSPNLTTLEIDAGYIGVKFGDESTSNTETEPRIEFCKIYSHNDSPGDGSMGIYVEDMHDAKIYNNAIGGYDIGVKASTNHAHISGTHVYAYPASRMTTGIELDGRWIRCLHNRVEHGIQYAGIECSDWFGDKVIAHNLIETSTGADGIKWSQSISDGEIEQMIISNNHIGTTWGADNGDTAIDLGAELHNSFIRDNLVYDFNNYGDSGLTSYGQPSASDHLPGAVVEDTSTGSLWYRTANDMVQIG